MKVLKKIILSTFLCLLFSSNVFSQVPGYLGKKFAANYDFGAGLRVSGIFYSAPGLKNVAITSKHNLNFEYSIARQVSFGLNLSTQTIGYDLKEGIYQASGPNFTTTGPLGSDQQYVLQQDEFKFNVKQFGVYFNFFFKETLAPIGTYFSLGFNRLSLKKIDSEVTGYAFIDNSYWNGNVYVNQNERITATISDSSKYNANKINLKIGKRNIIWGPIYLNYSAEMNWLFGTPSHIDDVAISPITPIITEESNNDKYLKHQYQQAAISVLRFNEIFRFNIGVGVLF